jgi:hypothetical protein
MGFKQKRKAKSPIYQRKIGYRLVSVGYISILNIGVLGFLWVR